MNDGRTERSETMSRQYQIIHSTKAWTDEDGGAHAGWRVLDVNGISLYGSVFSTYEAAAEHVFRLLIEDGVVRVAGPKPVLGS